MPTKPTKDEATFRDTVLDAKARILNTSHRLCVTADLVRNTLECSADGAAQVRLTSALDEIEQSHANLSAAIGIVQKLEALHLAENQRS